MNASSRAILGWIAAAGLACTPSSRTETPVPLVQAIEGRICPFDVATTPEGHDFSGTMKLVTAADDTFFLYTPSDLRCKPGTHSDTGVIGYGFGTTMRVYFREADLQRARREWTKVEWAEVECK